MRYHVEWTAAAEQHLAAIYLAAPDPAVVTAAMAWLDNGLLYRPLLMGRPRGSSVHRMAVRGPIGIEYEVIEDDKRVIVHGAFAVP